MSKLVSSKGRYALRAVIDIAAQNAEGFVPLAEIAARQEISEKYLEGILPPLVSAGVLDALRGKSGGYRLVKSAEQTSVLNVLQAVEGDLAPVACLGYPAKPCPRAPVCRTLPMWQNLQTHIQEFFAKTSIANLAKTEHLMDFVI
jgi:Rrf2 family protein